MRALQFVEMQDQNRLLESQTLSLQQRLNNLLVCACVSYSYVLLSSYLGSSNDKRFSPMIKSLIATGLEIKRNAGLRLPVLYTVPLTHYPCSDCTT